MRRRWICLAAVCLLLSACGLGVVETDWTAEEMVRAAAEGQAGLENPHWLRKGDEDFDTYLSAVYQLDPALVEDGAVAAAGGTRASEVAVLLLTDETAAQEAAKALAAYQEAREGDFTGYVPEEAAVAAAGKVTVKGRYAALFLCADPIAARDTFLRCFGIAASPDGGGEPAEPDAGLPASGTGDTPHSAPNAAPETDPDGDGYDAGPVLAAWRSGDDSGLSDKDSAILERCREVIDDVITEDMTPYEKELAIHDWMIDWAEYDPGALDQAWVEEDPDNDNPYGFLNSGVGICLGYTRTFQLFMDMLDIECIIVEGTSDGGTEEHAWNMVRLDGEWYCVDCTWDDPVTTAPVAAWAAHYFFNCTSELLRYEDHQWDESAVPEAVGTKYAWQG